MAYAALAVTETRASMAAMVSKLSGVMALCGNLDVELRLDASIRLTMSSEVSPASRRLSVGAGNGVVAALDQHLAGIAVMRSRAVDMENSVSRGKTSGQA